MTAGTLTLADFLLARIAEDEAMALAAREESPTPWVDDEGTLDDAEGRSIAGYAGRFTSPYIAHHDPDRDLAECKSKRGAIEAAWEDWLTLEDEFGNSRTRDQLAAVNINPPVVEWLASVYADHPDYDEAWRP